MLSSLDVLVLLKIVAKHDQKWTQPQIASELFLSQSVVSKALKTAELLKLYSSQRRTVNPRPLEEALVYGARYFLSAELGGEVRGIRTAWAASPLSSQLSSSDPLPPVWPDPFGDARGLSVKPLHPRVPEAAKGDAVLYELLALLDVFRVGGGARDKNLAKSALHDRLYDK